jgi:sigma-B regulation protein RsbU (phosphoserine phosphatase)
MNQALCGNTQNQFVTAAYVHLDAATETLRYSAAAHPPMLLVRDGVVLEIEENGLMLAAFSSASYSNGVHTLHPGDRIVLYTDGILEAANSQRDEFGRERLHAALRESAPASAQQMADKIVGLVQAWSKAQDDDLTVLVCDYVRAG